MQRILRVLSFQILVIIFSCEDQTVFVNCSDCTEEEPVVAILEAKLESGSYNNAIIQIWEGNLEDSILLDTYEEYSALFTQEVTLNKKYTITATYFFSDNKYIAVDSATPRVKYEKAQCENPCYFVYDRKCDLRLKYTKKGDR